MPKVVLIAGGAGFISAGRPFDPFDQLRASKLRALLRYKFGLKYVF